MFLFIQPDESIFKMSKKSGKTVESTICLGDVVSSNSCLLPYSKDQAIKIQQAIEKHCQVLLMYNKNMNKKKPAALLPRQIRKVEET